MMMDSTPSASEALLRCLIVVLYIFLFIVSVGLIRAVANKPRSNRHTLFYVMFEEKVRRAFPAQTPAALDTIMTGVNSMLRPNPERPSVLLLLAPCGAAPTALRLAQAVAASTVCALQTVPLSATAALTLRGVNYRSQETQRSFYRDVTALLNTHKVVVIADFQRLHPRTAEAFCVLTDDIRSPFRQALIIAVVDMNYRYSMEVCLKRPTVVLAENFLSDVFGVLGKASLTTFLSRLTGRSVLVFSEKEKKNTLHADQ